jgi:Na+/proline symporter
MSARHYLSPNDFITDRYRSILITGLSVIVATFWMIMFTALEWKSLDSVLKALLGENTDTRIYVWAFGMFIFTCECLGGMSSVALTDAVQAGLLLFAFFSLPCIASYYWGGYAGVGALGCQNYKSAETFGNIHPVSLSRQAVWTADASSPFGKWGTDECYTNQAINVEQGCAKRITETEQYQELTDSVNLPREWTLRAHTFGKNEASPEGVPLYCCATWNLINKTCDDGPQEHENLDGKVGICPPENTQYDPLTSHVHLYQNMSGSSYDVLMFNLENQTYYTEPFVQKYNESQMEYEYSQLYRGVVTLPDNSRGYTNLSFTNTHAFCSEIGANSAWHFKYPLRELTALMFTFAFAWISGSLLPITLHRVMTSASADSIRYSLFALHMFPILFFTPMILLGITAGALWPDETTSAMPLIVFKIAQTGSFGSIVGVLAMVGCIASFMSTADSIVICGSLLFTVDFYWNLIRQEKAGVNELMLFTKFMSFFMISSGILIATEADLNFLDMLVIGQAAMMSSVPIWSGLFFPQLRSLEVFITMVVCLLVTFTFQLQRWYPLAQFHPCKQCEADGNPHGGVSREVLGLPAPFGNGDPDEYYLWWLPPFWSTIASFSTCFLCNRLFAWMGDGPENWFLRLQGIDVKIVEKFDPGLDVDDLSERKHIPGSGRLDLDREGKIIRNLMSTCVEPVQTPMAWPFLLFPFFASLALPWHWGTTGTLVLESADPIGGIPAWAFDFFFVNATGTFCLMIVCAFFWKGREKEAEERATREMNRRKSTRGSMLSPTTGNDTKVAPEEPKTVPTAKKSTPPVELETEDEESTADEADIVVTSKIRPASGEIKIKGNCPNCGTVVTDRDQREFHDGKYWLKKCYDEVVGCR